MTRDKVKKAAYDRKYQLENKEKVNTRSREFYQNNEEYREREKKRMTKRRKKFEVIQKERARSLMRNYGITMDQYNTMWDNQGGHCAICGVYQFDIDRPLFVDHDHETNEVRGLLCNSCNSLIGFAKDNIDILESAINYLDKI